MAQSYVFLVKVTPKAGRNEVCVDSTGQILVRVTAVPSDGSANAAVIEILAKSLGIARSRLSIERGHRSKIKQISMNGIDQAGFGELLRQVGLTNDEP